jgi:phosphatidylinositol kinase/protein kinase (PI-3  family)
MQGAFTLACRHTLSQLRRRRGLLLNLLSAFIYDPLVEWTDYDCLVRTRLVHYAQRQLLAGTAAQVDPAGGQ